jgi:Putative addiction module component
MTVHPDVFDAALTLRQAERAELAHQLLVSLDEPADDPAVVAAEWAAEIERRVGVGEIIAEIADEGAAFGVPVPCLVAAVADARDRGLLDLLVSHPGVHLARRQPG